MRFKTLYIISLALRGLVKYQYFIWCALEQLHSGEQVHRERTTNGQFFNNHLEIPVNELGLGDSKDPIPIIGYYKNDLSSFMGSSDPSSRPTIRELVNQLCDWHLYKKDKDQFDKAENIRLTYMKSKGLNTSPNKLITPPKIHPQAIYTSRKLKFPIIPPNTQKMRNTTTYEDQSSSTIDLASLMVKDESFFMKNNLLRQRKLEEEIDEDLKRQYDLSIPFDELPKDLLVTS